MADKQTEQHHIDEQPEAERQARRDREAVTPKKPSQAEGDLMTVEQSIGDHERSGGMDKQR